jgi:hypothetical protein
MKILIIGGYGTFGGRLAHLLADDERLTLLIAGRSKQKAEAFCKQLSSKANKAALFFDRDGDVESQIREISPRLVVDATGPFQIYGNDPYRVTKACIANGIDYVDLADGTDFVKNVNQFDQEAKAKNIFVLSGVSSLPVLSAAVIRRLSRDLVKINSITAGIAPSPYAGVGLNVIRAISSYAGKRLQLVRDGRAANAYALTETMRYTISPPGHLPLDNNLYSLVDVPDLQVLPDLWPELDSIWMGAGPVPEILHRMLIGLSWLVRIHLLPSLLPFASLFHFVMNILRWGDHRGGMFVLIRGLERDGKNIERSWHLVAEGNDGPFIPSMGVTALIKNILSGKKPLSGARPGTQDVELEDYEAIFQTKKIYTGQRENRESTSNVPLYQRLLGNAWETLPTSLKKLHTMRKAEGRARVEVGKNPIAWLITNVVGFPKAGDDVPVNVSFEIKNNGELWQRTFAGRSFSSFHAEGQGYSQRLLSEQFGPFKFDQALVAADGKLSLVVRKWSMFGIPLPRALAPMGSAFEHETDGHFHFYVEIKLPLIGLIVRYQGWLIPTE